MAPRPQRSQGGRPAPRSILEQRGRGKSLRSNEQKYVLDYKPRVPRPPRNAQPPSIAPATPRVSPRGQALGIPERERARRQADSSLLNALEAAQDGDDTLLLPYQPTPSINPPRPRTRAAGYDSKTRTLRVRFRDGTGYAYYDVPPNVWRNFKRVKSPGRAINRTLNNFAYSREDF